MHNSGCLFVLLGLVWLAACRVEERDAAGPPSMTSGHPVVSTTIDFLDYVFYHTDPDVGYYTLDQYEEVIRSLAEAGFEKVYLRVDVCGRTLYPTRAGSRYRGCGREPGSTWLLQTLERYDPAAETIRLCRQYGLEPWAWDTLFDEEASRLYDPQVDPESYARYGEYPLRDPFFEEHPHFLWRLDPRRAETIRQLRETAVSGAPIERLRIASDVSRPNRVTREAFEIYVSEDNLRWRRLEQPWRLEVERENPPLLVLSELSVREPYLKLAWVDPSWPPGRTWTIAGSGWTLVEGWWEGAWHALPADWRDQDEPPEVGGFSFAGSGRFAWDVRNRALGITRLPRLREFAGMPEYAWPEVRAHKLAKLQELAAYDFDGFAFSLRTHTRWCEPENYGFGEPVREAFLARYGKDIWSEEFDRRAWLELRAEFVEQFIREAAASVAPRPLYLDWPYPEGRFQGVYLRPFGGLPFRPERWRDERGGVAGIRILDYPEDRLLPPNPAANDAIKTVRFVDNLIVDGRRVPHPDIFRERLRRWLADPGLDEIEYYETLLYAPRNEEVLRIIREEIDRARGLARQAADEHTQ